MKAAQTAIQKALCNHPNAHLSIPTPIHLLNRVSATLKCSIYIKREDLTGFALGGNKIRKLDFLIADAVKQKADTLITKKASSFTRNAAAAAKAFNLDLHVFIPGDERTHNVLSQAVFEQFGTALHYVPGQTEEILDTSYEKCLQQLKDQGKNVYELHPGGGDEIGTMGYINVFDEIAQYSEKTGIHFSHVIHSTGSSATQAGLLVGQSIAGYETRMLGMAASQDAGTKYDRICELARQYANLLNVQCSCSSLAVDDQFIGEAYAVPTPQGEKAVKMFADLEGIFLDQVYTGKAASGMIHYAETGRFNDHHSILFIHTGGNAGAYY